MTETTVTEPNSIAYVRYARKTSPKQYESAEASVSLPVDLSDPERTLSQQSLDIVKYGLNAAVVLANAVLGADPIAVLEQDGARVATPPPAAAPVAAPPVEAAFPGAVDVSPAPAPAPAVSAAPTVALPKGSDGLWRVNGGTSRTAPIFCPKCYGEMWDNSVDKRNPKSPDAKCKNKDCVDDKGFTTSVWMDK